MKPIERVKIFIEYNNLSISAFEKATGLSNNSIQTAIKRNSNLKDETLNTILKRFPELDPRWLLTGKGEMIEKNTKEDKKEKVLEDPELLNEINNKLEKALGYLVRLDLDSNDIKEGVSNTYKELIKRK